MENMEMPMAKMTHGQMRVKALKLRTDAMALPVTDPNRADLMRQYRECRAMCLARRCNG